MDVSKLLNYINTVLCVIIFLQYIFFSIFASHRFGNFIYIPITYKRANCEPYAQDIKTVVLKIKVFFFFYFFFFMLFLLRIVKSLQLYGRRQIVEPRKCCFVCDYFSLTYIFHYFFISQVQEFRTYSHHIQKNKLYIG